jgi:hypothetical protein
MVYQTLSLFGISVLLLSVISIVYMSWRNGITPMPTSHLVRQAITKELNQLSRQLPGLWVEAGSGWGTLALHVGRNCKGIIVIGIENSIIPLWTSKLLAWISLGLHRNRNDEIPSSVTFLAGDIYTYSSYAAADGVLCYLYPGAMKRLSPILRQQLAPGTTIISVCFALPDWVPDKVIVCKDLYRTRVYIYSI